MTLRLPDDSGFGDRLMYGQFKSSATCELDDFFQTAQQLADKFTRNVTKMGLDNCFKCNYKKSRSLAS